MKDLISNNNSSTPDGENNIIIKWNNTNCLTRLVSDDFTPTVEC